MDLIHEILAVVIESKDTAVMSGSNLIEFLCIPGKFGGETGLVQIIQESFWRGAGPSGENDPVLFHPGNELTEIDDRVFLPFI